MLDELQRAIFVHVPNEDISNLIAKNVLLAELFEVKSTHTFSYIDGTWSKCLKFSLQPDSPILYLLQQSRNFNTML